MLDKCKRIVCIICLPGISRHYNNKIQPTSQLAIHQQQLHSQQVCPCGLCTRGYAAAGGSPVFFDKTDKLCSSRSPSKARARAVSQLPCEDTSLNLWNQNLRSAHMNFTRQCTLRHIETILSILAPCDQI